MHSYLMADGACTCPKKPKRTVLYVVFCCDDELGECQGMFDASGKLLDGWYANDANWRNEYFSGFMKALGFKVEDREPSEEDRAQLKELFGL